MTAHLDRFSERIGAVFLPEADGVDLEPEPTFDPGGVVVPPGRPTPFPIPDPAAPVPVPEPPQPWPQPPHPAICRTRLEQGCYTLQLNPRHGVFFSRYRGSLRVEHLDGGGLRTSGDLYRYRVFDPLVIKPVVESRPLTQLAEMGPLVDAAPDTAGTIPVYRRRSYHAYLKGTGARLWSLTPPGPCWFTLDFDEFAYTQPVSGFSGSFPTTPTRSVRFVFRHTSVPGLYQGDAFEGTLRIGSVSIRWVSAYYRRAEVQLNTLEGAEPPPPDVGGTSFRSIFAAAGWDLSVRDRGSIPLPADLAGIDINACWSFPDMHRLMESAPGYDPGELDEVWRVHLLAIPARLGCSRGWMFDSTGGADPNGIPREGSVTQSHDGYPLAETVQYDAAADRQQREVPRAFLRSATHEIGHAFNQIHQNFEGGSDNSIMSPTPSVANVLGPAGTFPDDIDLAFNPTVTRHLRHLPDPAVRPGGMDFFGAAVAAPEPADVEWPDDLTLGVTTGVEQARLGEPIDLSWVLTNAGETTLPVPAELAVETLVARVSVHDPGGRVTFMRPALLDPCPKVPLVRLEPGAAITGSTTVFWGGDGFAFEVPGRHRVEVIVLWTVAGVPVAANGAADLFVAYPVSETDNTMAALLLDPEVGRAVAVGDASRFGGGADRIRSALASDERHPACQALRRIGVVETVPEAEDGDG